MKLVNMTLFLLLSSPCFAQEITKSEILDFGVYTSKSCQFSAGLIDGEYTLEDDGKLIEQTTEIPAKLGTSFGLRYRLEGTPGSEESVPVKVTHTHTAVSDPSSTGEQTVTEFGDMAWMNTSSITRFCFAEKWELAKGKWTIDISYGDKKLISKEFSVAEKK